MEHFVSLSLSSNMILLRLNHIACSGQRYSTDCIQCSTVKPRLLCRLGRDCEEVTLNGNLSVNAVNLVSLLVMPIIPKFNLYARYV